jgi:hypothetical protein
MYEAIIQVCYVLAGIVVGCTNGSVHTDNPQLVEQVAPVVYLYDAPSLVLNYYRARPNFVVHSYPIYRPQTVYRTRGHHHRGHTTHNHGYKKATVHNHGHKKAAVHHRSHKKATVHNPARKKVTVHPPAQPKKAKSKYKKRTKRKPARHHPKRRSRLD